MRGEAGGRWWRREKGESARAALVTGGSERVCRDGVVVAEQAEAVDGAAGRLGDEEVGKGAEGDGEARDGCG